jgi:nitrate reductase NapE component
MREILTDVVILGLLIVGPFAFCVWLDKPRRP